MSFMAVAYIPAFIEDYHVFRKDRQNGLYGPLEFQLSNFIIGLPYLCESQFPSTTATIFELPLTQRTDYSRLFVPLLSGHLLAKQLPCRRRRILQMDPLHLPRSSSGRVSSRTHSVHFPNIRGRSSSSRFCVSSSQYLTKRVTLVRDAEMSFFILAGTEHGWQLAAS